MSRALFFIILFSPMAAISSGACQYLGTRDVKLLTDGHWWSVDMKGRPSTKLCKHEFGMYPKVDGDKISIAQSRVEALGKEAPYFNYPSTTMTKETCTTIDLSKKLGPVKHQIGGTCYAYAAAELLEFKSPKKLALSALSISLSIRDSVKEDASTKVKQLAGFHGKKVLAALEHALKHGVCPEPLIPTRSVTSETYQKFLDYYSEAETHKKMFLASCSEDMPKAEVEETLKELWRANDAYKEIFKIFPRMAAAEAQEFFLSSTSSNEFMRNMADKACESSLVKLEKKVEDIKNTGAWFGIKDGVSYYASEKRKTLLDHINQELNKGSLSAASYYTKGLITAAQDVAAEDDSHASVIVGRHWVKGDKTFPQGCYYKIRNSWGEDWKPPAGVKAFSSDTKGHFMVSEAVLMEHLSEVTSLE